MSLLSKVQKDSIDPEYMILRLLIRITIVFAVVILLIALYWYKKPRNIPLGLIMGPHKILNYQNGQIVNIVQVPEGSGHAKKLQNWFRVHHENWSVSLTDYPNHRLVRGFGFEMNVLPDGECVVKSTNPKVSWQVVRKLTPGEFEHLQSAIDDQ